MRGAAERGGRRCASQMQVNLPQPFQDGRIPGYSGFCPGMNNHAVGKTFNQAAVAGVRRSVLFGESVQESF